MTFSTLPGQGRVYRDPETLECLPAPEITVITQPGCSDFPVTDNDYGSLPTRFPDDVEIDTFGYNAGWEDVEVTTVDPGYVNLWKYLPSALKSAIYIEDCYCPGEGPQISGLTIGQPRFPSVRPLPFFWVPSTRRSVSVRPVNPEGPPLPPECCPGSASPGRIEAAYNGNEMALVLRQQHELEKRYRSTDVNLKFQMQSGYPRWCCGSDPDSCDGESIQRYLHFPRWLTGTRNPYSEVNPEEPLGVVPVVVDIQCDADSGMLYVYYANLIYHDGHLHDVAWDASEPRSEDEDVSSAPANPATLPYNEDYQGTYLISTLHENMGAVCDDTCAAAFTDIDGVACDPECSDCTDFGAEFIEDFNVENKDTRTEAVEDAWDQTAAFRADGEVTLFCWAKQDSVTGKWSARIRRCNPDG